MERCPTALSFGINIRSLLQEKFYSLGFPANDDQVEGRCFHISLCIDVQTSIEQQFDTSKISAFHHIKQ